MQPAARHAHGRLVSVLEGGYELNTLKRCVVQHMGALLEGDSGSRIDG
jgi:acetoin utilization deacetylase AcuC-like enzyme